MKSKTLTAIFLAALTAFSLNAQPPQRSLPEEIVFSVSSQRNDLSGRVGISPIGHSQPGKKKLLFQNRI